MCFLLILAGLVVFNFAVFSADNSNYTSTDDVKKAQMAMASNEYYVTPGDLYSLVYQSAVYTISVDSNYKVRIANLGIINTKGMTIQDLKNKVETLVVSNYPTSGVQFFLSNPSQFNVYVKGEVSKATSVDAWALNRLSDIISGYFTSYSSKRDIKIISIEGEEKALFKSIVFFTLI